MYFHPLNRNFHTKNFLSKTVDLQHSNIGDQDKLDELETIKKKAVLLLLFEDIHQHY